MAVASPNIPQHRSLAVMVAVVDHVLPGQCRGRPGPPVPADIGDDVRAAVGAVHLEQAVAQAFGIGVVVQGDELVDCPSARMKLPDDNGGHEQDYDGGNSGPEVTATQSRPFTLAVTPGSIRWQRTGPPPLGNPALSPLCPLNSAPLKEPNGNHEKPGATAAPLAAPDGGAVRTWARCLGSAKPSVLAARTARPRHLYSKSAGKTNNSACS